MSNKVYEHVGWQQRYIDIEEGPSIWTFCDDSTASILHGRSDYELREVFALVSVDECKIHTGDS